MNGKLWWRIPIVLGCVLLIGTAIVFGKVAYAASASAEFGDIIKATLDAYEMTLQHLYNILVFVW